MDWISGMQSAIDYIEEHLAGDINYEETAKRCCSSSYHFQRAFSILCGYTLGEYIRNRRLTLAGIELQAEKAKVIDAALKYGYDSPDSFAKAFKAFHGILPSQARSGGMLKSFSRMTIKVIMEGGFMNYRIEQKPEMILTGYKRRFSGDPALRDKQEEEFFITTRENQYILKGLSKDVDTQYTVISDLCDDGYNFYIASKLGKWSTENLDKELGAESTKRFEKITIPSGQYLICETERMPYPTEVFLDLRREAVSSWLPSSGYQLRNAPEVTVSHWYWDENDPDVKNERYIELWLPIEKK